MGGWGWVVIDKGKGQLLRRENLDGDIKFVKQAIMQVQGCIWGCKLLT